jgi:hypothetical protein
MEHDTYPDRNGDDSRRKSASVPASARVAPVMCSQFGRKADGGRCVAAGVLEIEDDTYFAESVTTYRLLPTPQKFGRGVFRGRKPLAE